MAEVSKKRLAKDALSLAAAGGMPDTYWSTDQRIARACAVLGLTRVEARKWAYAHIN